jgi:hypothetical protein
MMAYGNLADLVATGESHTIKCVKHKQGMTKSFAFLTRTMTLKILF